MLTYLSITRFIVLLPSATGGSLMYTIFINGTSSLFYTIILLVLAVLGPIITFFLTIKYFNGETLLYNSIGPFIISIVFRMILSLLFT